KNREKVMERISNTPIPNVTVSLEHLIKMGESIRTREQKKNKQLKEKNDPRIIMVRENNVEWDIQKATAKANWEKHWRTKEWNKKRNHKTTPPKCENCYKACYLSGHATKVCCQRDVLNYCTKCYNDVLEELEPVFNRRRCPNHEECVAFESRADRSRFGWEDEDFNGYFRDYTKCRIHTGIRLLGEYLPLCRICDEDTKEMRLWRDNAKRTNHMVAIKVMLEWAIKEHPESPEYPGAILDIWEWTETPEQKEVRLIEEAEAKRIEEEKEEWKGAEKIYEELLPKDYLWLRQRIEKLGLRDQVIHEITGFRAYKAPIRICYWCYGVHLRRE